MSALSTTSTLLGPHKDTNVTPADTQSGVMFFQSSVY